MKDTLTNANEAYKARMTILEREWWKSCTFETLIEGTGSVVLPSREEWRELTDDRYDESDYNSQVWMHDTDCELYRSWLHTWPADLLAMGLSKAKRELSRRPRNWIERLVARTMRLPGWDRYARTLSWWFDAMTEEVAIRKVSRSASWGGDRPTRAEWTPEFTRVPYCVTQSLAPIAESLVAQEFPCFARWLATDSLDTEVAYSRPLNGDEMTPREVAEYLVDGMPF